MIHITDREQQIILSILDQYINYKKIIVFGSRITERFHCSSDIDLAIVGDQPIDSSIFGLVLMELSDSDLPYKVDIVDMCVVNADFKNIINSRCELLSSRECIL